MAVRPLSSGLLETRLFIAAKAPRPGVAKTRLGCGIGHDHASRLYAAFLRDLGARYPRGSWYVTPGAWPEIAALVGPAPGRTVLVQPPGDWTCRQRHLLRRLTADGDTPAVLIASDSPHLDASYVQSAFSALSDHELVLGPTHDGGYALIGMRRWFDVLQGVAMSTGDVVARIRDRAHRLGARVQILPPTFDVDDVEDLVHLRREVRHRGDLEATAAALREISPARSRAPLLG